MLPIVAIVGRPNVGKSTLFNVLTRTRNALVVDFPGVTRDRQYGRAEFQDHPFMLIDTGGIVDASSPEVLEQHTLKQAWEAINEAHVLLFVVDAKAGITREDESLVQQLRSVKKPIYLIANKCDGEKDQLAANEFYQFGYSQLFYLSARNNKGIGRLMEQVVTHFPKESIVEESALSGTKIAIVGKPNVGKSTLINRLLGEERLIVSDVAGTTRDSIYTQLERHGKHYTLIDTAGVRRKSRVYEKLEKFSIVKTLQAIDEAEVVLLVINAQDTVSEQDLKLIGYVHHVGKALVIAVNKWDGLSKEQRDHIHSELDRRLTFVHFVKIHFISALHGTGVGELYPLIDRAYASATREIATADVTRALELAIAAHQPPMVSGRRIKIRYAHMGGQNPPRFVIHGNQLDRLPGSYVRYLEKFFRDHFRLEGTPIHIEMRVNKNPYV